MSLRYFHEICYRFLTPHLTTDYLIMSISRIIIYSALVAALAMTPCTGEAKKKKEQPKAATEAAAHVKIHDAARQLYGEWNIELVHQKAIHTSERAYLYFHFAGGNRLYGCTGCNTVNGKFEITGDKLQFKDLLSTNLSCSGTAVETEINEALRQATNYYVTMHDNVEFMHVTNKKGDVVLLLRRHNLDFLAGSWLVKTINDLNVSNKGLKLVADMDQLTINATSGCNIINGVITLNYNKDFAVEFSDLVSSHHKCPNIDYETQLLLALEQTAFCRMKSNDETELLDENNQVLVVLKKIGIKQLK